MISAYDFEYSEWKYSNRNNKSVIDKNLIRKLKKSFVKDIIQKSEINSKLAKKQKKQIHYENGKFKNSFTDKSLIGEGSYGDIFKVKHKLEDLYYAVKRIDL